MHDPETLVAEFLGIQVWHHDPCKDGTDDSCGWFKRARHGNKEVLKKIISRFEFDWDRTFTSEETGKTFMCGYFTPDGVLVHSPMAITINLIWIAAFEHFKHDRNKATNLCKKELFDILFFAENPTDSLFESIIQKWGSEDRQKRIESMAGIIYGWVLRADQKWYQHPRWHIWHWRLNFPIYWHIKRKYFDKNRRAAGIASSQPT